MTCFPTIIIEIAASCNHSPPLPRYWLAALLEGTEAASSRLSFCEPRSFQLFSAAGFDPRSTVHVHDKPLTIH